MTKKLIPALLLALAGLTGCTAPSPATAAPTARTVGEQVHLTGRLNLKGSMPMVQAVLTDTEGQRWELKGITPAKAERLQNKLVAVDGKVVRPTGTPMMLPSLDVTDIVLKQ